MFVIVTVTGTILGLFESHEAAEYYQMCTDNPGHIQPVLTPRVPDTHKHLLMEVKNQT